MHHKKEWSVKFAYLFVADYFLRFIAISDRKEVFLLEPDKALVAQVGGFTTLAALGIRDYTRASRAECHPPW